MGAPGNQKEIKRRRFNKMKRREFIQLGALGTIAVMVGIPPQGIKGSVLIMPEIFKKKGYKDIYIKDKLLEGKLSIPYVENDLAFNEMASFNTMFSLNFGNIIFEPTNKYQDGWKIYKS